MAAPSGSMMASSRSNSPKVTSRTADDHQETASRTASRLSRCAVLFPARRSRHAGAELRRADPDRRAAAGTRPRQQQTARRPAAGEDDAKFPALSTRISSRSLMRLNFYYTVDRDARAAARAQHAGRRQQSQYQPQLLGAGFAQFLDRSEKRDSLLHAPCKRRNIASPRKTSSKTRRSRARWIRTARRFQRCSAISRRRSGSASQSVYNHSNIQAVYDVYGSVQDSDLGAVAADCRRS